MYSILRSAILYPVVCLIGIFQVGCAEKANNSLLPFSADDNQDYAVSMAQTCGGAEYWKRLNHFSAPWLTRQFDYHSGIYTWGKLYVNLSVDAAKNRGFSFVDHSNESDTARSIQVDDRCHTIKNTLGSAGYTSIENLKLEDGKHVYFLPELQIEFHTPTIDRLPRHVADLAGPLELQKARLSIELLPDTNNHHADHQQTDELHKKVENAQTYKTSHAIQVSCEKSFQSEYRYINSDPSEDVDPELCVWTSENTYGCLAGRVLPDNNVCSFEAQKISIPNNKGGIVVAEVSGDIAININDTNTLHISHVNLVN